MTQLPYTFTKRAKQQNIDVKTLIVNALNESDYDMYVAADSLGISRQSLQYHMKEQGISIKRCTKIEINGEQQKSAS